ncbi:hypothetical protein CJ030_MR7G010709 [Morella rubra]|uniref:Uncharacterized protein n=1 Tax=Morella rubra TaxID=262757 RepID=A0A6A1V267_9ROSI|nr:hypothetical protein CJ030_MR7G010709 [Morella rubra]
MRELLFLYSLSPSQLSLNGWRLALRFFTLWKKLFAVEDPQPYRQFMYCYKIVAIGEGMYHFQAWTSGACSSVSLQTIKDGIRDSFSSQAKVGSTLPRRKTLFSQIGARARTRGRGASENCRGEKVGPFQVVTCGHIRGHCCASDRSAPSFFLVPCGKVKHKAPRPRVEESSKGHAISKRAAVSTKGHLGAAGVFDWAPIPLKITRSVANNLKRHSLLEDSDELQVVGETRIEILESPNRSLSCQDSNRSRLIDEEGVELVVILASSLQPQPSAQERVVILACELERVGMLIPEQVRAVEEVSKEFTAVVTALKVKQTFRAERGVALDSLKRRMVEMGSNFLQEEGVAGMVHSVNLELESLTKWIPDVQGKAALREAKLCVEVKISRFPASRCPWSCK